MATVKSRFLRRRKIFCTVERLNFLWFSFSTLKQSVKAVQKKESEPFCRGKRKMEEVRTKNEELLKEDEKRNVSPVIKAKRHPIFCNTQP